MPRFVTLSLFILCIFSTNASSQKFVVTPLHVPAGTILTFHLQTRLHPTGDSLDALPKGTVLQVKILDSIDSAADQDGTEFHGTVASPVRSGNTTLVHTDAEVHGLLALLRSKSHPDGFRYELLITSLTEPGARPVAVTASLNSSFSDDVAKPTASSVNSLPTPGFLPRVALPLHH